jgi:uncharacterized protein (TIGR02246 family)
MEILIFIFCQFIKGVIMNGDNEAITKLLDAYVEHWNNKDLDQWGKLFTSDVDYVNRGGGWWQSNVENVEGHKKLFERNMERVAMFGNYEASVEKITFLKEDIALAHARWRWPQNIQPMDNNIFQGVMTLVLIKVDNRWYIRAVQNTVSS